MFCGLALALCGCGRGPVQAAKPVTQPGSITFELFVQGRIAPSQGDYIIALNANSDANTNVNPNETPGQPTVLEAQAGTYTHWDQELLYGFDTALQSNGFAYAYKAINNAGGGHAISFVPIILNSNDFTFIPNASTGNGSGNVLKISVPIADLSIRGNPNASTPPTIVTPPATLIYVNYITLDTTHTPQDQLGCCGLATTGYQLAVSLTQPATYLQQLTAPPGKAGPSNPNLFISGGEIIVSP